MEQSQDLSVYLKLLEDILVKKKKCLQNLLRLTREQEQILADAKFNDEDFNTTLVGKEKEIETLNNLDSGFTKVFTVCQAGMKSQAAENRELIEKLQALIPEVTALGAEIQTLEKKNKGTMEKKAFEMGRGVKNFKVSKQTADRYYKNMVGLTGNKSYFLDKNQ